MEDEEEATRAASCASASLQRGKDFPVATKDRRKGAVPGQEDGNDLGGCESNRATVRTGKRNKNNVVLHTKWRLKAMVPREARAHCSIVRLAKRREGIGVESLADLANQPHAGRRGPRVRRNQALSRQASRSDRAEGRNNGKCGHMKAWQWCHHGNILVPTRTMYLGD